MLHGEIYLLCNLLLCGCALPVGGKLAGVDAPGFRRWVMGTVPAGLSALAGLLHPLAGLAGLPLSVWLCYRPEGRAAVRRCLVTTLCAALLLGGSISSLLSYGAAPWAAVSGSLALEGFFYLLIRLLPAVLKEVRHVELQVGGRQVMLPAMVDSGNLMRDPITSLPVLVIPMRAARALYPDAGIIDALRALPRGFRLLHVRTAAGNGLLPLFRPDHCWLYMDGIRREVRLLAAVAGSEYKGTQALVPLAAIRE